MAATCTTGALLAWKALQEFVPQLLLTWQPLRMRTEQQAVAQV